MLVVSLHKHAAYFSPSSGAPEEAGGGADGLGHTVNIAWSPFVEPLPPGRKKRRQVSSNGQGQRSARGAEARTLQGRRPQLL